jgi:hypothetical protein
VKSFKAILKKKKKELKELENEDAKKEWLDRKKVDS